MARKPENKFSKIYNANKSDDEKAVSYDVLIKIPDSLNNALHYLYKDLGYKSKQDFLFNLCKESLLKKHKELLDRFNIEL